MFQKPFIVEDGHVYYPKKPLYQQPLFWTTVAGAVLSVILGILVFFLGLSLSQSAFKEMLNGTPSYEESDVFGRDTSLYTEFSFGEMHEVEDDLEVTVETVKQDDAVELVGNGDVAVVAEVILKNTSKEDYYLNEFDFGLYDSYDYSYELDYRTYDVNIPEKLAPGETVTLKLIYGADEDEEYGLAFGDYIWRESIGGTI